MGGPRAGLDVLEKRKKYVASTGTYRLHYINPNSLITLENEAFVLQPCPLFTYFVRSDEVVPHLWELYQFGYKRD